MNRALSAAAVGALLSMAGFAPQCVAGPIVSSYSGSYSIVSNDPASVGSVSLRLAIEPLFADCAVPGLCTELLRLNGLGAAGAGTSFALNLDSVLNAVSDGTQLFSFSMNFGSPYSAVASGGSLGLFGSALSDTYEGQPVESATFTIKGILFSTANSPSGLGTEATLEYTLALHGFESDFTPESLGFGAESDSSTLTVANPEPASWLMMATGVAVLWGHASKSFNLTKHRSRTGTHWHAGETGDPTPIACRFPS